MRRNAGRRKWVCIAAILIVVIAAYVPCANLVMAARLLSAVRSVATGDRGQDLRVTQRTLRMRDQGRDLEAILYVAAGTAPTRSIILTPGISELGCYHPRLVALSRYLANSGFLVLTPDIVAFREFRITAEPVDEIVAWFGQIRNIEEGRNLQQIGLSGVSFSGTLALIAAARPEVRDSVGFVMGIGCYYDLHRLSVEWFRAPDGIQGDEPYPTRYYAKWIMMLAALDLIPAPQERDFLHRVLVSRLLQIPTPPEPLGLSAIGRRWHDLAVADGNLSDAELAQDIERFLTPSLFKDLDPKPSIPGIRCPVFLVHGSFDDLIPPEESRELGRQILTGELHLLISPFLTHTHPREQRLPLVQAARAGFDSYLFFYAFARILR